MTVSKPVPRDVVQWDEYTGHLDAPEVVQVSARVSGLIVSAPFEEGAIVHKGDACCLCWTHSRFEADLDSKQADVEKADAQAKLTELQFKRYAQLIVTKAVSQQDYDNAYAAMLQAKAALAGAKAAQETSQLSLEWSRVMAPITEDASAGNLA